MATTAIQSTKDRPSTPALEPAPLPGKSSRQPDIEPRPHLRDWIAMIVWTACFGVMALIHVIQLIVGMFR
jgi:hypothetical protein